MERENDVKRETDYIEHPEGKGAEKTEELEE